MSPRRWTDLELAAAVATCSAAGLSRQEIAVALGVSVAAVRGVAAHPEAEAA